MQDEKEWFGDSIRECERCMYLLAFDILQNNEDVQDAIQDAILKAYSSLDQLKDRRKLKAWLMKILLNVSYDIARKRKITVNIEDIEDGVVTSKSDQTDSILLRDLVMRLKPPYRTVVILFYYQDFSIKEISDITGSNLSTVKKQLQRAREQLKEMI